MNMIENDLAANLEQIRLNDINIANHQAGLGSKSRTIGESLHDDTAKSIAQLMNWNDELRGADAILAAALKSRPDQH
jgi:hypothetical protein